MAPDAVKADFVQGMIIFCLQLALGRYAVKLCIVGSVVEESHSPTLEGSQPSAPAPAPAPAIGPAQLQHSAAREAHCSSHSAPLRVPPLPQQWQPDEDRWPKRGDCSLPQRRHTDPLAAQLSTGEAHSGVLASRQSGDLHSGIVWGAAAMSGIIDSGREVTFESEIGAAAYHEPQSSPLHRTTVEQLAVNSGECTRLPSHDHGRVYRTPSLPVRMENEVILCQGTLRQGK